MADTLKLEIVTPESKIYSEDVEMVTLPGSEGEAGIYPNHVPLMTKVPLSVIKGISPIYTSCSLISLTDREAVSSSTSQTTSLNVTLRGAAYVIPLCWHSSTS